MSEVEKDFDELTDAEKLAGIVETDLDDSGNAIAYYFRYHEDGKDFRKKIISLEPNYTQDDINNVTKSMENKTVNDILNKTAGDNPLSQKQLNKINDTINKFKSYENISSSNANDFLTQDGLLKTLPSEFSNQFNFINALSNSSMKDISNTFLNSSNMKDKIFNLAGVNKTIKGSMILSELNGSNMTNSLKQIMGGNIGIGTIASPISSILTKGGLIDSNKLLDKFNNDYKKIDSLIKGNFDPTDIGGMLNNIEDGMSIINNLFDAMNDVEGAFDILGDKMEDTIIETMKKLIEPVIGDIDLGLSDDDKSREGRSPFDAKLFDQLLVNSITEAASSEDIKLLSASGQTAGFGSKLFRIIINLSCYESIFTISPPMKDLGAELSKVWEIEEIGFFNKLVNNVGIIMQQANMLKAQFKGSRLEQASKMASGLAKGGSTPDFKSITMQAVNIINPGLQSQVQAMLGAIFNEAKSVLFSALRGFSLSALSTIGNAFKSAVDDASKLTEGIITDTAKATAKDLATSSAASIMSQSGSGGTGFGVGGDSGGIGGGII